MRASFYLVCSETKQAVHVADRGALWFRGANLPNIVSAFCAAHDTKELMVCDGDRFSNMQNAVTYKVWTQSNANAEYFELVGKPLAWL